MPKPRIKFRGIVGSAKTTKLITPRNFLRLRYQKPWLCLGFYYVMLSPTEAFIPRIGVCNSKTIITSNFKVQMPE